MENQVKTSTDHKEQQLKKLSKMTMIRVAAADCGTDYHLSYCSMP